MWWPLLLPFLCGQAGCLRNLLKFLKLASKKGNGRCVQTDEAYLRRYYFHVIKRGQDLTCAEVTFSALVNRCG